MRSPEASTLSPLTAISRFGKAFSISRKFASPAPSKLTIDMPAGSAIERALFGSINTSLARRPRKGSATHEVQMSVENGLTGLGASIES